MKRAASNPPTARRPAASTRRRPQAAAKRSARPKPAPRKDFGAPIDGFFAKQPAALRPVVLALRELVEEAVPDAQSSLKWGMPFYTLDGEMVVAIGAHKAHVNLILAGPPAAFADPDGRLAGEGKGGRHLKLKSLEELPRAAVRAWVRTAAALARKASSKARKAT